MDLLEYQAKKLFRQVGIPVLPSETIANPRELKQLQIPYPVVLKSQVRVGGRGKAGGVKFVNNTIDAIAAARRIFNLPILGEYPEVILAEAHYNAQKELFLSIVLDYHRQCPVMFGSIQGGMDIESLVKNLQQVVIEQEFAPFLARSLAVKMGVADELLLTVSKMIEKMYQLFVSKDLDSIEINPLGIDAANNLMALDGKITVNDSALTRHPDLIDLGIERLENFQLAYSTKIDWLDWYDPKGKIALLTNHQDLSSLCWSQIRQKREKPACAIVIKNVPTQQQWQQIIEDLSSKSNSTVLLINFWATSSVHMAIAESLYKFCQIFFAPASDTAGEERSIIPTNAFTERSRRSHPEKLESKKADSNSWKFVIRLPESDIESYQQKFAHDAIYWTNDLNDSISQAISWSKVK